MFSETTEPPSVIAKTDSRLPARAFDADLADIAALEPVQNIRKRWPTIVGGLLTIGMLAMLGREVLGSGLSGLNRMLPASPWFYVAFVALYLTAPMGDWLIFRRLWRIPFVSGFVALNKKRIANDVLLGYSGEAYFYTWARARTHLVAAPFGAVKDVSLLSAVAGNTATILLCALALPIGRQLFPDDILHAIIGSVAITIAVSLVILLFSRRVFSLPRRDLWATFGIHCLRIAADSILIALCWHFAMPDVSIGIWLFLSAARLLVSRLPLVPNKELLFASFAILVIGRDQALSGMIAFVSALTLATHLTLMVVLAAAAGVERYLAWRR